jgi:hypothetical protein
MKRSTAVSRFKAFFDFVRDAPGPQRAITVGIADCHGHCILQDPKLGKHGGNPEIRPVERMA